MQPWTVSESSWRIVSWFMKGPWLPSCCTSLFRPIKLSNISLRWPTCGSLADTSLGLVPPRPGWPCLDTDSATTIVSLPGELLNLRCTILIFLAFFPPTHLLIFDLFLGSSIASGGRNPFSRTRQKTWRPTAMLGPTSLSTPIYAPTWRLGFRNWKMSIPKSSLNSRRVSERRHSLPWGSPGIMCLQHTRIQTSCIPWFLGLSEVFFTSHLFSLFFPLIHFVSGSYCACVILSRGRGECGEICFPRV
jgi:hypothetical protein